MHLFYHYLLYIAIYNFLSNIKAQAIVQIFIEKGKKKKRRALILAILLGWMMGVLPFTYLKRRLVHFGLSLLLLIPIAIAVGTEILPYSVGAFLYIIAAWIGSILYVIGRNPETLIN